MAVRELETNSEIEAFSIANSLGNALYAVSSNLELIATSPSTSEWNIPRIQILLEKGLESTSNITDGYYLLDKDGNLTTFTGIDDKGYSKYVGTDLSTRDYFKIPMQNGSNYISTVIFSNDNIPRMYISVPIYSDSAPISQNTSKSSNIFASSTSKTFEGAIVASIETKMLGKYLEGQIHPNFSGEVTFVDRNGTILYTKNQTVIGEKISDQGFQKTVQAVLKNKTNEFNTIILKAMHTESGMNEFQLENNLTTIAYNSVSVAEGSEINSSNRIGTLFITAPHTLAEDVTSLINVYSFVSLFTISVIVAISFIVAILLLKWNGVLGSLVNQRTILLNRTVKELSQSNEDLKATQNALATANKELAISNSRLKTANKELKAHDLIQKEFINIAAHELRTPSQAISGNLELIEIIYLPSLLKSAANNYIKIDKEFEDLISDKHQLHEFIQALLSTYRNSQRLEKLVNDILDVSRIDGKRLELDKVLVNINEQVKNVITDIYSKATEPSKLNKNNLIDIRIETGKDPMMVFVDRPRIFQAITNIINNAIKFSESKPITVSIRNTTWREIQQLIRTDSHKDDQDTKKAKKVVVVSIKDNGKGIDEEIFSKLFTKFASKSSSGTGLGLFIAKSIIVAHGGEIWAQNNYDEKGATVSFYLPLEDN